MSRKSKGIVSKPSTDEYRDGHERIFGASTPSWSDIAVLTGNQDLTAPKIAALANEAHAERMKKKRKKRAANTGTYAIRNGELVKISDRADGYEDPSKRLNCRAVQWTELPRGINPAREKWKKWQKVGSVQFPVFDGDSDRREYQKISRDVGNPVAWVK